MRCGVVLPNAAVLIQGEAVSSTSVQIFVKTLGDPTLLVRVELWDVVVAVKAVIR